MGWQLTVVIVVVAVCVVVMAVKLWRVLHGDVDCGCGAGTDCPHRKCHDCNSCPHR